MVKGGGLRYGRWEDNAVAEGEEVTHVATEVLLATINEK